MQGSSSYLTLSLPCSCCSLPLQPRCAKQSLKVRLARSETEVSTSREAISSLEKSLEEERERASLLTAQGEETKQKLEVILEAERKAQAVAEEKVGDGRAGFPLYSPLLSDSPFEFMKNYFLVCH